VASAAASAASQISLLGFGVPGKTQRAFLTKQEQDGLAEIATRFGWICRSSK